MEPLKSWHASREALQTFLSDRGAREHARKNSRVVYVLRDGGAVLVEPEVGGYRIKLYASAGDCNCG